MLALSRTPQTDGGGCPYAVAVHRTRALSIAVVALLSLTLAGCGERNPFAREGADLGTDLQRLHALVNEVRAEPRVCGNDPYPATHALTLDARLVRAAQVHSDDMRERGVMSHVGSDGSSVGDRVTREGYAWSQVGENVAVGFATPEAVLDGWLGSPGHCANLMRSGYTELGLGRSDAYWTQVFAVPR